MKTYRKPAVAVGALFLIALILNLIASEIMNPILNIPDYLVHTDPDKSMIIFGNLLNFICAIAMILIPIVLFPVVRKKYQYLASAYVVFRALEGILFIFLAIKTLSLISLSKEFLQAAPGSVSVLRTIGNSVHAEIHWATLIYLIIFCFGGATFYILLYKSKLIPRFMAVWGFLAIVLLFTGTVLAIFGLGIFSHMQLMKGMAYFAPPIALNELFLGIWLITKGFSSATQDSETNISNNKRLIPGRI
jgi:hypothetical protein